MRLDPLAIKFLHPDHLRNEDLRICGRDASRFDGAVAFNGNHPACAVLREDRKGCLVTRSFRETKTNHLGIAEIHHYQSFDIQGRYIRRRVVRGCRSKCGNTYYRDGASAAQYTQEITSIHSVHVDSLFFRVVVLDTSSVLQSLG